MATWNWRNWTILIASIIYAAITFFAIYLKMGEEGKTLAIRASLMLMLTTTLLAAVIAFCFEVGAGTAHELLQRRATVGFLHFVVWGAIVLLPFQKFPIPSFIIILLFIIASFAQIIALNEADLRAANAASMKKIHSVLMWVIGGLIIATAVVFIFDKYQTLDKIGSGWNSFKEWFMEDSESGGEARVNTRTPGSNNMTATIMTGNSTITTNCQGTIDVTGQKRTSVQMQVFLNKTGDVILKSSEAAEPVNGGWIIKGNWFQSRTGQNGYFTMVVSNQKIAVASLYRNGALTSKIEIR